MDWHQVLNSNQLALVTFLQRNFTKFYLAGGTAIALQLGHRESIDFDLFSPQTISTQSILNTFKKNNLSYRVAVDSKSELTLFVNEVKLTFLHFPFGIETHHHTPSGFTLPNLIDSAAMKAYALGRRNKWKDYVDLFFLLRDHFSLQQITDRTTEIFGADFSPRLLPEQLMFFADMDYSEEVIYLQKALSREDVQQQLEQMMLKATNFD